MNSNFKELEVECVIVMAVNIIKRAGLFGKITTSQTLEDFSYVKIGSGGSCVRVKSGVYILRTRKDLHPLLFSTSEIKVGQNYTEHS